MIPGGQPSGALTPGAPLAGVLVVDLSRVLAGPLAAQQCADLGARVIKIEAPQGDATRGWGPPFVDGERSAYFLCCNRGKESVALDLSHPASREAVRRLVARADIVIENFLPGTLERWGLGLEALRQLRPQLITCTISGYGSDGPRANEGGYDALLQAQCGLMAITGPPAGPWSKVGVAVVDVVAGLHAASGLLALLAARARGQTGPLHLEVALHEAALGLLANVGSGVLVGGQDARRYGNGHPHIVPYRVFECRGGEMFLGVGDDAQWQRLGQALGEGPWQDPAWAKNRARVAQRAAVEGVLEQALALWSVDELVEHLRRFRVPAAPLRGVQAALADPLVTARGTLLEHPDGTRTLRSPARCGQQTVPAPPPALGAHTASVLAELGYSPAEIEAGLAAGWARTGC